MRVLCAASSLGWDAKKKHAEMFHRFSRFILVFQGPEPLAENLVAFSMFRFENEEEYCVLYCYELQVKEEMRGMGIGRCLMNVLECIGSEWRMQKLMLTVLKANKNAVKFYATVGFQIDASSPTNFGYKEDYEILSRVLEEEDFDFDEAPPNTNH
ncbi:acyl-CoA N-acyltransferase [Ephemerocybe angulata]|uniref:N-alpha-acetyltransferase 40 n=1 Tax=Ephemerocybe angulata TaxID=980116 RepID=A0A8H6IKC8_9AGAR|nr:acyl-CoA N-acyltransferase [Tulosesus angulatus]